MPYKYDDDTDNDDSDHYERDPGREVIEKNMRNRLQRIADNTKDELNKVLKRVDTTLTNYEYSVQSSLVQHGMARNDKSNIEHVADLNELENILNDSLAKQRYKQRLMIFIVGQTELASEKASLLQQVEQFFNEQKQSFSGNEFTTYDIKNETQDEVDLTLRSFDVKDCYIHVRELGSRLNELNEDIIQYLIQNAAAKQQAKGKKKFAQAAKDTKDQLSTLQSKLESAANEMINKDYKIETLENANEKMSHDLKTKQEYLKKLQEEIVQCKIEIKSRNKHITELEVNIQEYKDQINDLQNTILDMQQSKTDTADTTEPSAEPEDPNQDEETQTSPDNQQILFDDSEDLNVLLNVTDGIDLNYVTSENLPTAYNNLRKFSIIRVKESLEGQTDDQALENIKQEYEEYKITSEQEKNALIEKADNAYQLQKAAEEALSQLELFMAEQEKQLKTDEETIPHGFVSSPEHSIPVEMSIEHLSSDSENDDESIENGRRSSVKERYVSFIEERKNQLSHTRRRSEAMISRSTSVKQRTSSRLSRNNIVVIDKRSSHSSSNRNDDAENQLVKFPKTRKKKRNIILDMQLLIKQDQQQQTSTASSRRSSSYKERIITEIIETNEYKLPFFDLYELIYKFRHSIINLLEQNKFLTLADRLLMIKQLSSDDHYTINAFMENSDHVLKDTCKVLQACIALLLSSINEYQIKEKEKEIPKESSEPTRESSSIDDQQELILEQKESMIIDLTNKYAHLTTVFNQMNAKHQEESAQNERLILDQQKLIQNLQQQLIRLQKRLAKIEVGGIVEPSIMFTRLDAERNEQTLQQAVHKGKVLEATYHELNEVMDDYVRLPSQQLTNLVKRYIHFRKTTELEDRIESEVYDNDTRTVLEKMELLHERRSAEIRKHMLDIRQQRTHLAKILTDKFDHLEDESSIFLIRPVYSYQGRAAAQSYMKQERRQREALLTENPTKTNHYPSRQSHFVSNQQNGNLPMPTPLSSLSISDEEERIFNIENSLTSPRSSLNRQPNDSIDSSTHHQQFTIQLSDLTRLQQFDIQRTLIPISHVSAPLLSAFANNSIDPGVPSLNLRSYAAFSRPGNGNVRMGKPNEMIHPVSRESLSTALDKSQVIDGRTPFNSSNVEVRRKSPQLPPIKRSLSSSVSAANNEKQYNGFVNTNEISSTN